MVARHGKADAGREERRSIVPCSQPGGKPHAATLTGTMRTRGGIMNSGSLEGTEGRHWVKSMEKADCTREEKSRLVMLAPISPISWCRRQLEYEQKPKNVLILLTLKFLVALSVSKDSLPSTRSC